MAEHLPWPQSLRSAHALDTLARELYQAHVDYYSLQMPEWEALPQTTRLYFLELSRQTLDALQPPNGQALADRLFAFGVALNQSQARVINFIHEKD